MSPSLAGTTSTSSRSNPALGGGHHRTAGGIGVVSSGAPQNNGGAGSVDTSHNKSRRGKGSTRGGRDGTVNVRRGGPGNNTAQTIAATNPLNHSHTINRTATSLHASHLSKVPEGKHPPLDRAPEKRIVMATILVNDPMVALAESETDAYVEWITSSLRELEEIEFWGIDPALADAVSVMLILCQSGIIQPPVVETLTMESLERQPKSCLRACLKRGPTINQELKRKSEIQRAKPSTANSGNVKPPLFAGAGGNASGGSGAGGMRSGSGKPAVGGGKSVWGV